VSVAVCLPSLAGTKVSSLKRRVFWRPTPSQDVTSCASGVVRGFAAMTASLTRRNRSSCG